MFTDIPCFGSVGIFPCGSCIVKAPTALQLLGLKPESS